MRRIENILQGHYVHPDFMELARWLGPNFELSYCDSSDEKGLIEAARFPDNETFVRNTMVFCYQNIGLMTQGIHRPYIAKLLAVTADMFSPTVIEVGAGGGQLGLALHTLGFDVSFADIYSNSWLFLKWRLMERKLNLPLYIWDDRRVVIPKHDIAVCFDTLEHLPSIEEQHNFIDRLAEVGNNVFINLIRGEEGLTGPHYKLDPDEVVSYIASKWNCGWNDYYPDANGVMRQRLAIYGDGFKARELKKQ